MSTHRRHLGAGLAVLIAAAGPLAAREIPPHPSQLDFGPLEFEVPRAEQYRHELSNGVVVYVVEDHDLPLIDVGVTFRAGSFLEQPGEEGLATLTGQMMRQGGAGELSAEELDERLDFLAADLVTSIGDTSGSVRHNSLTSAFDESLDLMFDVLRAPRFQEDRLEVARGNMLESMKQRNDAPTSIAAREWQWLMYGSEHFSSRLPTASSVAGIGRDDLAAFHRRAARTDGMVVAVAGAVTAESVLAALESRFADWPAPQGEAISWPPREPQHAPSPGLYHVEKDIPQGRVQIGHLGLQWQDWEDPSKFAVMVMNDVLGGGGFTSRLTKRIRSDEGLAYSAGSSYGIGTFWPGTFNVFYQSKNPTVGYAARIALEEIRRIQAEPVSAAELQTSKASFIDTFPRRFENSTAIANLFAADEFLGRPHAYWYTYRDRIRAVDAAAVQAAARAHLHPDRLVTLVVGPWEEIAGEHQDERGDVVEVAGAVIHLPLRDPLTLEPQP